MIPRILGNHYLLVSDCSLTGNYAEMLLLDGDNNSGS